MSNQLKGYIYSIAFLFISHLVLAIFLAIPMYYCVLESKTYEIIATILSVIIWTIAGGILGRFIYSKALLSTIPIVVTYLLLSILYLWQTNSFSQIGTVLLRIVCFALATRIKMDKK